MTAATGGPVPSQWEATVDGWKAEIEAMSDAELLASFGPLAEEDDDA